MPETLLSPSNVLLFGRVVTDLRVDQQVHPGPGPVPGTRRSYGKSPCRRTWRTSPDISTHSFHAREGGSQQGS